MSLLISFGVLVAGAIASGVGVTMAQAAVVKNIDVRGNQRIDDEIVASYLTISPGQNFNNFDIDDSVKALYGTGLFSDVSIYQQGSSLVVEVDENSTVNKVFFEGNSRHKDEILKGTVKLQPQSIYSDEQAASDVELIDLAYARVGRQDAEVTYEVVPLANNRVNVIYRINEGAKTKISQIIFVGNDTFDGHRLRDVISTKESTILSFLTTSDIYDPNRLSSDEELLRNFYFNKGFADFQVVSTTADLDDVENEYVITITIEEGPRYTFGNITIESTIPGVNGDGFYNLLETSSGEYYSAKAVEKSILSITERVAEEGFAFVEVVPRGNRNFDTNTIDVTYLIDEGARVYIEDIQILGNDRTRDYVIRREFDLSEGDAYNRILVQKTKRRLEELGFFQTVSISTRPGSGPDKVIIYVTVLEQSTGDLSLSGGYSTNGGASGEISFTERNFLGRGQYLRLSYQGSADENGYGFNFVEPFFLGYRISAGLSLNSTQSDDTDERQYTIDSTSAAFTFGIPITENLESSVFYAFNTSETTVSPTLLDDAVNTAGNNDGTQGNFAGELSNALVAGAGGDWVKSGVGYSLTYTDLDNIKDPREGVRASLSQTFYGAGGDASYVTTQASFVGYGLVSDEQDLVLFGRVRGGHNEVLGADNGTNYRTLDNFQANSKHIRGFESFGYGPRDPVTGDALGGHTYWNATTELQFPLPFVPRSLGLRGAVFADAGQLLDVGTTAIAAVTANNPGLTPAQLAQLDDDELRASFGGSILWNSPFGPLRVDYAVPVGEQSYDKIQEISFGVSSRF